MRKGGVLVSCLHFNVANLLDRYTDTCSVDVVSECYFDFMHLDGFFPVSVFVCVLCMYLCVGFFVSSSSSMAC